jgi:hypothetical protein
MAKLMNTYYLVLRVIPAPENSYVNEVAGALASCWVCGDDPAEAVTIGSFKVRQQQWEIVGLEEHPIKVTEKDYLEKEMALDRYTLAQVQGMSVVFAAWSKDGKTSSGPFELANPNDFILSEHLSGDRSTEAQGALLAFIAYGPIFCGTFRASHSFIATSHCSYGTHPMTSDATRRQSLFKNWGNRMFGSCGNSGCD